MNLICVFALLLISQSNDKFEDLHPAFKKSPKSLQAAWDKGEADSSKLRDPLGQLNKFRKGIGKIRTAPLREETVSWIWYLPPENFNYYCGFDAKKKYRAEDEVSKLKAQLIPDKDVYQRTVEFFGSISLYPSFGGGYGRIDRIANPNDLKDVRVVLKIGGKIYQPQEQPGDLLQQSGTSSSTFSVPRYDYATVNTTATATATGSGGYAYGSGRSTSTIVRQYNTFHEQNYDWYRGTFSAVFSLFDKEGNPILKKDDDLITVIVVYGSNERQATFKLRDLEKPL